MKVIETSTAFKGSSGATREALEALAGAMRENMVDAYKVAQKVASSGGQRVAAFGLVIGKVDGHSVPWLIVEKTVGAASKKLVEARKTVKAVPKSVDMFFKGARYAKGSLGFKEGRLVLSVADATVSADKIGQMFSKPAPGLKSEGTSEIKRLVVLLREAVVVLEGGDLETAAKDRGAADYAGLGKDELAEFFASDDDVSEWETFANVAKTWTAELAELDQQWETDVKKVAPDELYAAAFASDVDIEEQASLWLEYRAQAPRKATVGVTKGKTLSKEDWLDVIAPDVARLQRIDAEIDRLLDIREGLVSRLTALGELDSTAIDDGTFSEYRDLTQRFDAAGDRIDTLMNEDAELKKKLEQSARLLED